MTIRNTMYVVSNDRKGFSQETQNLSEQIIVSNLLGNCYSNPAEGIAVIPYTIKQESFVEIYISDVFRKVVANVLSKKIHPVGQFKEQLNISKLSHGIYYYTLKTNGYSETKKFLIIR